MGEEGRGRWLLWVAAILALSILVLTVSSRYVLRLDSETSRDSGASGRVLSRPQIAEPAWKNAEEVLAIDPEVGEHRRLPITDSEALHLRILAKDSGKPVSSAVINAQALEMNPGYFDGPVRKQVQLVVDDRGRAKLPFSTLGRELTFRIQAEGYLTEHFFEFQPTAGVLTVRLKTSGVVTGRVSSLEEGRVRVELYLNLKERRERVRGRWIEAEEQGLFRFDGLEAGSYALVLSNRRGTQVKVHNLVLGPGEALSLEIDVPPSGRLEVRTREVGSGMALPGQEWHLSPKEGFGEPRRVKSNSAGLAIFADVAPGLWFLSTPFNRGRAPQVVRVRPEQTTQVVDYLSRPVRLELQLTGAGLGLQDEVRVTIVSLDRSTRRKKWRSRRDGAGRVVFRGLPANTPLLVEAAVESPHGEAEPRARLGIRRGFELPSQLEPCVMSLQLLPPCEGELIVTCAAEVDAMVRLGESRLRVWRDWKPLSKTSDDHGVQRFRFTSFPGPCDLIVRSRGHRTVSRRIRITGESQVLEVNLRPASQIDCRFVHSQGSVMSRAMVIIERCGLSELHSNEVPGFTPMTAILGPTGRYTTRGLAPGSYDVTVVSPEGQQGTHRVELGAGELRTIQFLQDEDGYIRVAKTGAVPGWKQPTRMGR